MSKPRYQIGEIVVYESPSSGRQLLQIINRFKSFMLTGKQFYDGMVFEIVDTPYSDIPKIPKFVTGVTRIPEENLKSLETIL